MLTPLLSTDELLKAIEQRGAVADIRVLVREFTCRLYVGHDSYRPTIRIKIYLVNSGMSGSYHFDVSHFVHTPVQASAYFHTRTEAYSELAAIDIALSSARNYFQAAIREGHDPDDSWLIPNTDF